MNEAVDLHGCSGHLKYRFHAIWQGLSHTERAEWPLRDLNEVYVFLYQHGIQEAFEELWKKYYRLLQIWSKAYFLPGGDSSDVLSAVIMGFFVAINNFKPGRIAFTAFAKECAKRAIMTAITTANRQKHAFLTHSLHLDFGLSGEEEFFPYVDLYGHRYAAELSTIEREVLLEVLEGLTEKERTVLIHRYIDGKSYQVTALELQCSTKSIDNTHQRIRRKAQRILHNHTT